MLNGLDLFSGIGGITYALQEWVRPVAYCEIEPYCQSVLLQRMQKGDLPKAPIWDDIKTLSIYDPFTRNLTIPEWKKIDIITAGFPCQDISVAGSGKGLEGERSGLFFEIVRLAKEIKPPFLFLENVPAITSRGGLRVVREVTEMGYDCRWCVISASGVGALHRRERWFLLAHSKHDGESSCERGGSIKESIAQRKQYEQEEMYGEIERTSSISTDVANSQSKGLEGQRRRAKCDQKEKSESCLQSQNDSHSDSITGEQASKKAIPKHNTIQTRREYPGFYRPFESRDDWQKAVSSICRVTDGLPNQVDRLKALGNAVVPQQVRQSWQILTGLHGKIL